MRIMALVVNLVPYHVARWAAVVHSGCQVLLVQRRASDPFAVLGTSVSDLPFQVHTLLDPAVSSVSWYQQIYRCVENFDPDVIVVNGYSFPEGLAGLLVARERQRPVVVCSESNRHDAPRSPVAEALKARILHGVQAALVGGEPQAAYLERLGMHSSAIFRGYNAVDNRHFATASRWRNSGHDERIRLGLPERYLLAVSRFTPKKNLSNLIDGFARWRRLSSGPDRDLHLLILGDGPLRSALETQITTLGLENIVHLPGPCSYSDLPSRYGLAEGLIHASTVEQWGLVVNEAMAAGLPVLVSSACGCVPQLVHPGLNGLRFEPSSPDTIACAIGWLARMDPYQYQQLCLASRRLVRGFGPEAFAAGLMAAVNYASDQQLSPIHALDRLLFSQLIRRSESHA